MAYEGLSKIEAEIFSKPFVSQRSNYKEVWKNIIESDHVIFGYKNCADGCIYVMQIETQYCSKAIYLEFQKEDAERYAFKETRTFDFDCWNQGVTPRDY